MTNTSFVHLFSAIDIGPVRLKNRIMSTGHDTCMADNGRVSEAMLAYHEARARGGAGLIVLQVSGVHETARYTPHQLMCIGDRDLTDMCALADACHQYGCKIFAQLFHPGREIIETADGRLPVAYAPSAVPNDRFHVMPRALSRAMISEIVAGFAEAAAMMKAAGLDGVEIVASHGYLPSQFLNPQVNRRSDEYGGDFCNRVRFLDEVVTSVRGRVGSDFVVGLRISGDEMDEAGLPSEDALEAACQVVERIDYVSVTAGTSASTGGAVHIVPPMSFASGYVSPITRKFRTRLKIPVFIAGRINQPQEAEKLISAGDADVCGMTRALICDPELPQKSLNGKHEDIRACIGCNQACVGHFQKGVPISCIQHPETGRELLYGKPATASRSKDVMVIGGGPAGMKAASVAAVAGHRVKLYETSPQLGGQVLLALRLPNRMEFGGIITNLTREMLLAGVEVQRNCRVDLEMVERAKPDAVVLATGARPRVPDLIGDGELQIVTAWDILKGDAKIGSSVVVADWRCDWIGVGIAEQLARAGHRVRLAVNGLSPAYLLQSYMRDLAIARLGQLNIEFVPHARIYGFASNTVYFQQTTSREPIVLEEIDTLVLCSGHESLDELGDAIADLDLELHVIGDCLTPRTAEEAVYEGLQAGWRL